MAKRAGLYRIKWLTPLLGVVALLCSVGRLAAQPDRDSLICRLQTRLEDAANLTKVKANTEVIDTLTPLLAEFPKASDPTFQWLEAEYRFHIGYAAYYRGLETNDPSDKDLTNHSLTGAETLLHSTHGEGTPLYAKVLRQQGMYAYFMEDNVRDAQEKYDDAYRVWITIPNKDSVELAVVLQCMGQTAGKLGEYERAIELYKQSLEIRKRIFGERHQRVGVAYWNLGNALGYSDRFEEATNAYENALEILLVADPPDNSLIADIQMNLATNYAQLGRLEEAISYHESSLKLEKAVSGSNSPNLVDRLANLAIAYLELGNYSKSIALLDEADRICAVNGLQSGPEFAAVKYHRALLLVASQATPERIEYNFRQALQAISNSWDQCKAGEFTLPKANATLEPLLMQQVVLAFAEYLGSKSSEETQATNSLEASLQGYELAAQLADRLRIEYQNQEDKLFISGKGSSYLTNALEICDRLFKSTRDSAYASRALRLMESCKSQLVLEFYKKSQNLGTSGLDADHLVAFDSLHRRAVELEYQSHIPDNDPSHQKALRDELTRTQLALKELQTDFEKRSSGFATMVANQRKVNLSDIQHLLAPGTTFINFVLNGSRLCVLSMDQKNLNLRTATLDSAFWTGLHEWKALCQRPLESKDEVKRFGNLGFEIYRSLIGPEIAHFPNNEKLIIIPDDELCNLQFEALVTHANPSEKHSLSKMPFLIRRHQCQYAPSATLWLLQQEKGSTSATQKCLGMAWGPVPRLITAAGEAPFPGLPGTSEEVEAVQSLVEGQFFVGDDASEAEFKRVAAQFGILHLALHASASGTSPAIMFPAAGSEQEDGILYFHEIFPLKLQARMAVLSACESGTGRILEGEGIQSMSSGFSAVGIPSLLMTLWEVSDQSGKDIVLGFYKGISEELPIDQALREAKLEYLDKASGHRASPYFWAAYMASGNMDPIHLSSPNAPIWPWATGCSLILVCIFLSYRIYKKNRISQ
ncbi:MAG: CHAT domain-containing tetratricopeptide repeat protein [Bacteroidia bacterium]